MELLSETGPDGELGEKIILHVDMDAFFVSVEEVLNPKLKGKQVIVGGDPNGRGVVSSASYEARKMGVTSAMPMKTAKRLCPRGIFLKGSHYVYGDFSRRIMEILRRFTPALEQVSVDEAYLDLTGCQRVHKAGPVAIAQRIHDAVRDEVGVPCSIGIASNKVTAKIASTLSKPHGLIYIKPGYEGAFLAPLPIGKMPGVGPATETGFVKMGIRTIGDLARFPQEALSKVFGVRATELSDRAGGKGGSEVDPEGDDAKSIGRELTYSTDTDDPELLLATLSYLSESVGTRLRRAGCVFRRVTVKLRYADFNTYTRSRTLEEPSGDTRAIYKSASDLLSLLHHRGRGGVRLVGVSVSMLAEPPRQAGLFENRSAKKVERLNFSVDRAREMFGFESAMTARSYIHASLRASSKDGVAAVAVNRGARAA